MAELGVAHAVDVALEIGCLDLQLPARFGRSGPDALQGTGVAEISGQQRQQALHFGALLIPGGQAWTANYREGHADTAGIARPRRGFPRLPCKIE